MESKEVSAVSLVNEELTKDQSEVVTTSSPAVKKTVEEYLKDPAVIKSLNFWASHLDERFHGNWFSLAQVMKKTSLKNLQAATDVMGLLICKDLAHCEERNQVQKYKITLKSEDKLNLLINDLEMFDAEVSRRRANLVQAIDRLKDEIAKTEKKSEI